MPTTYTNMIDEDPTLSTSKWVTEGLSRNFGVCVILRDGPYDLTEDEIEAHLEKEILRSTRYHREKISEAKQTLKDLEAKPEAWNGLHASTVERMKDYNKRRLEESNVKKLRHQQVKEDLTKLRDTTDDEITRNIAKFGLSQLELVKGDTEPFIQEIPHLKQFKIDQLTSLNWDIEYHTKEMEKTEKRERERLSAYQIIKSEVKKILG